MIRSWFPVTLLNILLYSWPKETHLRNDLVTCIPMIILSALIHSLEFQKVCNFIPSTAHACTRTTWTWYKPGLQPGESDKSKSFRKNLLKHTDTFPKIHPHWSIVMCWHSKQEYEYNNLDIIWNYAVQKHQINHQTFICNWACTTTPWFGVTKSNIRLMRLGILNSNK